MDTAFVSSLPHSTSMSFIMLTILTLGFFVVFGQIIDEVPSKPLNVSVIDIGSDQIRLKWSEPERTNGAILGYRVYYMYANYTDVQSLQILPSGAGDSANKNYIHYNLTNLRPYTEYKIWVKAYTDKHEGEPSEPVYNRTDISGPNAPRILNLTCQAQDTVFVQWERPTQFLHSIDFYYIYIGGSSNGNGDGTYDNITLPAETKYVETSFAIHNVTTNANYEVRLGASTRSNQSGRVVQGLLSPAQFVHLRPGCDQARHRNLPRGAGGDLSAGMIAGAVCAAFAFCLAICAFVLWRKCFHAAYYYLDDPPCSVPTAYLDWNAAGPPVHSADATANANNANATNAGGAGATTSARADCCYKGAIPVSQFARHVAELHADGDIGFSKEYEAIQMDGGSSVSAVSAVGVIGTEGGGGGGIVPAYNSHHSQHPDNRAKNRYLNIIAYDHSRVQLLQMPGQKKQIDYINANYIDGFQWLKAYIGTQGPLPSTFDCFWRMVWEQRVHIIVMITNLVERGRRKCDMYWPKEGTETYGVIQVKLVKEDVMATYTVRTLLIRHLKIKKKKQAMAEKYVYQYHYTSWPDHGTPDHPLPVLHFVKKSAAANPPDAGPIVVHCSAGVGRTGTYIVLDAMLRQIRARNEVNVFGFLRHIRTQRNFLVQTEEQYIFIHDALVEAIESGETNVTSGQFVKYMQLLIEAMQAAGNGHGQNNTNVSAALASNAAPTSNDTNVLQDKTSNSSTAAVMYLAFEYQFKLATSFQCRDFNLVSAHKPVNVLKNRLSRLVPVESARVHLTPKPGEDGSDYINATWLPGFGSLREFIVTQHPLPHTVNDFWQMVWDHNAQTLVVLSHIDNQDFDTFWPATADPSSTIDSDTYRVRLTHAQHQTTHSTLDFSMRSMQDDYELNVRMVQCADWPRRHCGDNTAGMQLSNGSVTGGVEAGAMVEMLALPALVQAAQVAGYQNGPVVVVDRYGGAEAAIFCALATLRKHLHYDNHLDVYMYAKLYHNKRPGIWSSGVEDYLRLHRALYALCTAPASTVGAIGSVLAPVPAAAQNMQSQPQIISQPPTHGTQQVPDLYANANGTPATLLGSGGGVDAGAVSGDSGNVPVGDAAQVQVVNGSVSNDSVRVPPEESPLIPDVMKIHIA